jgi:hypothetical protein
MAFSPDCFTPLRNYSSKELCDQAERIKAICARWQVRRLARDSPGALFLG